MKSKKNPKADVRRNSSIFFAVGLVLMLLMANFAINYRTYEKGVMDTAMLNLDPLDDEVIPITDHPVTPPPPIAPPVIPDDFDIKDDDDDVIEDIIDTTEDDPEEPIVDIEDVKVDEPEEDVEVIWTLIEDVPVFPGCEKVSKSERRSCMASKITKHVQKKFKTELADDLGLSGKQKISVLFKIDRNGDIVGVQTRAPHPRLEKEAERVINLLPKMKPGKQRGEPVTVKYSLPIVFQVQN
jgi:protein TonB